MLLLLNIDRVSVVAGISGDRRKKMNTREDEAVQDGERREERGGRSNFFLY
jgi:hypothetical protein